MPYLCANFHDPTLPAWLIIDPVHDFKSLRNNWHTQKEGKMRYFDFESNKWRIASWSDLVELQQKEQGNAVKRVFISHRAVHPSSFDKQKVRLAAQIFNEKTVAALMQDGKTDAAIYVRLVTRLWNIINVQDPNAWIRLNDPDRRPITSVDDPQVQFLLKIADMFESMNDYRGAVRGFGLTRETRRAIVQTLRGLVDMAKYLLELGMKYVLLGHFQSDDLERRFGIYRQRFGGLYLIGYEQVLLAEKLERIKLYDRLNTTPVPIPRHLVDECCSSDFDEDEWAIIDTADTEEKVNLIEVTTLYWFLFSTELLLTPKGLELSTSVVLSAESGIWT